MTLYHGSQIPNLARLSPAKSEQGKPLVYLTTNPVVAILYIAKRFWHTYRLDKATGIPIFTESHPNALRDSYAKLKGYLYECQKTEGMTNPTNIPCALASNRPVNVIRCTEIPDALQSLLEYEEQGQLIIERYADLTETQKDKWREFARKEIIARDLIHARSPIGDFIRANFPDVWKEVARAAKKKPPTVNITGWKRMSEQLGSNPGGFFKDASGTQFYIKGRKPWSETLKQARARILTEFLAYQLYALAGVPVPEVRLGQDGTETVLISRQIPNLRNPDLSLPADVRAIQSHFLADAWLANWDSARTNNAQIDSQGNAVRLDAGGCLDYRAQGEKKGTGGRAPFGESVGEVDSMRRMNPEAFGRIQKREIQKQAQRLGNLTDEQIRNTVHAVLKTTKRTVSLTERLINRRNDIVRRYGK